MGRLILKSLVLVFLVVFASFVSCSEARKLLSNEQVMKKAHGSRVDSLFRSALPKGTAPSSTPSKKGHAMVVDEKLFAARIGAVDRILPSVPSPGLGH